MSRLSFPSDQQAGVVNLADVLDPLSADHSAALRSLIDTNGPGYTYRIPDGFTVKLPLNLETAAPRLRNHVYIEGEGPGSVISITGYGANPGANYMGIGLTSSQQLEDIDGAGLRNLTLQGDGPGATQTWTNRQAAAVRIGGSTQRQDNLVFQDVIFLNHDGFPLHADANTSTDHSKIERCQFINNGNGLNYNANFVIVRHCKFMNCEGIENANAGNIIDGNLFYNVFAGAIGVGGNQSSGANKRAIPGTRIVNNTIFGVLGGGSYGVGAGIGTATSSPDVLVANNYVERTQDIGIKVIGDTSGNYGPDDGVMILGNHLVNCGDTGGLQQGIYLGSAKNTTIVGNRIYNRVASSGDYWPLGTHKTLGGILMAGSANTLIDGNFIDMSNGGQYCLSFGGPAPTGLTVGRNTLIANTGSYAAFQYTNAATFADASGLLSGVASGASPFASMLLATYRTIRMVAPGGNRTVTLLSAVNRPGLAQTFVNTDGTFTLAVTPNGAELINGSNAVKTLGVNSAVTLTSDGSNWLAQIHYGTFA